jgi:hypothetical protein
MRPPCINCKFDKTECIKCVEQLALERNSLKDQLHRRNALIKKLRESLREEKNKNLFNFREDFTLEEIEILRDITVNTGQDKFRGSYPLMSSINSKVVAIMIRKQKLLNR